MPDKKQYPYPPQDIPTQAPHYPEEADDFAYPPTAGMVKPGYEKPPPAGLTTGNETPGQEMGLMGPPKGAQMVPPRTQKNVSWVDDGLKYSGGESGNLYGDIHGFDFSEKTIRRAFIRKVYGILSVQILLTASIIALFSFHEGVKSYVQSAPWLAIFAYIAAIVLIIVLACCEGVRRKSPYNVFLLGLFTLTYGYVIGVISSLYEPQAIVLAAVITTVITVGLTAFAFQTKIDFTLMGGFLFCCMMVMFIFGGIMIFLPHFPIAKKIYACLGALLFSMYLIYDTQSMICGYHTFSISPEEYVFAALNIYLDIIMIFINILRLLGRN